MKLKNFDAFLTAQLWVGIPTHLNWALLIPLVHKLQGELWTASIIAIYFVAMQAAAMSVKLFSNMSLSWSYRLSNVATLCMIGAMGVYLLGYEPEFLIIEGVLGVLFVISGSVHSINLSVWMIGAYPEETIKEYKIYKEMRKSFGSLLGYAVVALIYSELDTVESMWSCIVFTGATLVLKEWNWWVYYRGK